MYNYYSSREREEEESWAKIEEVNDALERANEWRILAVKDVKNWKMKVADFIEHLDFTEKHIGKVYKKR